MPSDILFETSRLSFRRVVMDDAPAIFQLNTNPEVIRYTGNLPFSNIKQAAEVIRNNIWKQYNENDYGRWAVILKSTNEFIGWCGLKFRPDRDAVDIGYRFAQAHWGKGIATEAAQKCLDVGFEKYNLDCIIGCAFYANKPSIRVLEKIGMTFKKEFILYNTRSVWYEKRKESGVGS